MIFSMLPSNAPQWTPTLEELPHDFYQLPDYVALEAKRMSAEPVLAVVRTQDHLLAAPLALRPLPEVGIDTSGYCDAISPYGYGSLLFSQNTPQPIAKEMIATLHRGLADAGVVCAFIRLHPILSSNTSILKDHGSVVVHGPTVWMDLTVSEQELWRQTRSSDRNRINKLRRRQFTCRIDTDWERFEDFLTLYQQTMERVVAADWLYFCRRYFIDLRSALGDQLHLCVVEYEGELTAAGLFTLVDGIVQFHLSGTSPKYWRDSPARLMIDHMRRWGKKQGAYAMHLGGGVGAQKDALFMFKAGLSKLTKDFSTYRMVSNPELYEALSAKVNAPNSEYFPPYRT